MSLGVSLERPYPDFEVCDSAYGTDLSYSECLSAAEQFPKGTRYERWGTEGYPLPFQRNSGELPGKLECSPDDLDNRPCLYNS